MPYGLSIEANNVGVVRIFMRRQEWAHNGDMF